MSDLSEQLGACTLCPRLCRHICPVAAGSGREAATPSAIATLLRDWQAGRAPAELAAQASTLCVDCGACQEHCYLDRPLPAALREARSQLLSGVAPEPLAAVQGDGSWCAIEADERELGQVARELLQQPVRVLRTGDRLGAAAVEHPALFGPHAAALRGLLGGYTLLVLDGGVARVLRAAGLEFRWLHEISAVAPHALGSCECPGSTPRACCGGAEPLVRHHHEDAIRVGRAFLRADGLRVLRDARCREHLRRAGGSVTDVLDVLLAELSGA